MLKKGHVNPWSLCKTKLYVFFKINILLFVVAHPTRRLMADALGLDVELLS